MGCEITLPAGSIIYAGDDTRLRRWVRHPGGTWKSLLASDNGDRCLQLRVNAEKASQWLADGVLSEDLDAEFNEEDVRNLLEAAERFLPMSVKDLYQLVQDRLGVAFIGAGRTPIEAIEALAEARVRVPWQPDGEFNRMRRWSNLRRGRDGRIAVFYATGSWIACTNREGPLSSRFPDIRTAMIAAEEGSDL